MSHVMYTQYKQHKQAMKMKWSECKVQLKQKDNIYLFLSVYHPFIAKRCIKDVFWYHFHCDSIGSGLSNCHSYCNHGNCCLYLQKVCASEIISLTLLIQLRMYIGKMKGALYRIVIYSFYSIPFHSMIDVHICTMHNSLNE